MWPICLIQCRWRLYLHPDRMQQHKYTQRELWTRPWNQHRWTGTGQHKSMCVKCYSKRCQHVQNHEWCQDQDLAGWCRIGSRHKVLKYTSLRSSNTYYYRSVLLWQKHLQKSNISSGSIRGPVWEHQRDIYNQTCPLCMQWQLTLFRDLSYRCATQTSASTPLPPEQPVLLASFWGTLHPDCPSHSLLADWKTCWEQLTDI